MRSKFCLVLYTVGLLVECPKWKTKYLIELSSH